MYKHAYDLWKEKLLKSVILTEFHYSKICPCCITSYINYIEQNFDYAQPYSSFWRILTNDFCHSLALPPPWKITFVVTNAFKNSTVYFLSHVKFILHICILQTLLKISCVCGKSIYTNLLKFIWMCQYEFLGQRHLHKKYKQTVMNITHIIDS